MKARITPIPRNRADAALANAAEIERKCFVPDLKRAIPILSDEQGQQLKPAGQEKDWPK